MLITVPALKCLWSSEDDVAGHYRRYNYKQLKRTVEKCGFNIKYENYFFEFAFLPIILIRVLLEKIGIIKKAKLRSKDEKNRILEKQFKERKGLVAAVLNWLERIEMKRLVRGDRVRFGSSLICVIEKRV